MEINIIDLILNQGPAYFMAGVFAWLYIQERHDNAVLHRVIRGTLREVANLPDENLIGNGQNDQQ